MRSIGERLLQSVCTLENSASRLSSSSCIPTLSVITRKSLMKICTINQHIV